ncbi:MAG: DNA mismatch repair protein MutS [Candidatus Omnitrophota bacterium]
MSQDTYTPMLKQYHSIKAQYPDCVLFFRLGDFYEMFYEDAKKASGILDLVLTSRPAGQQGKVPMCGVPYHAADTYISRLIKAGIKVAICEQVEDPALARGIVKREVIRVVTSGTFIDDNSSGARYLLALSTNKNSIGIAFTDTASGTIQAGEYKEMREVVELMVKLPVYECVFPAAEEEKIKTFFDYPLLKMKKLLLTSYNDWCFNHDIAGKTLNTHFGTANLAGFGLEGMPQAMASAGALLEYLKQMHRQPMRHIAKLSVYADTDYMYISPAAVYGLELDQLCEHIDHTRTAMGRRLLQYWMYHPLKDTARILSRRQAVSLLKEDSSIQQELGRLLRNIPDIEKSLSRISCGYAQVKDFLALYNALIKAPALRSLLAPLAEKNRHFAVEDVVAVRSLLESAINADVPLSHPEGKIIRAGYHAELDTLRDIQENGRNWLRKLQQEEIQRTGINSLKIGFNNVFGYYIEVTNSNLKLVPADYIRKQTLSNAERFITPQLKEFEEKMLTAEEKILKIEKELLQNIQKEILEQSASLQLFSSGIAIVDMLYSLSMVSLYPGYVAPQVNDSARIEIIDGRHPVVERTITESFVPNDTLLDCRREHLLVITGPNMAGKSTYIRQSALLVIMAQAGSYIPAKSASIGIVDKIFTRIGAHDQISKGQSTFMVEMTETAQMLNNLSARSLVILDEVGRGTSTFDGLSLAWAIAEYLQKRAVRALFATHFHELTALAEECSGVKNYNVAVKEWKEEIIFLHKIVPGGTDDSYGIYVAKLAGIPGEIIQRANEVLLQLQLKTNTAAAPKIAGGVFPEKQLTLFARKDNLAIEEIRDMLQVLDINSLTPLEALNKLQELKDKVEAGFCLPTDRGGVVR